MHCMSRFQGNIPYAVTEKGMHQCIDIHLGCLFVEDKRAIARLPAFIGKSYPELCHVLIKILQKALLCIREPVRQSQQQVALDPQ